MFCLSRLSSGRLAEREKEKGEPRHSWCMYTATAPPLTRVRSVRARSRRYCRLPLSGHTQLPHSCALTVEEDDPINTSLRRSCWCWRSSHTPAGSSLCSAVMHGCCSARTKQDFFYYSSFESAPHSHESSARSSRGIGHAVHDVCSAPRQPPRTLRLVVGTNAHRDACRQHYWSVRKRWSWFACLNPTRGFTNVAQQL